MREFDSLVDDSLLTLDLRPWLSNQYVVLKVLKVRDREIEIGYRLPPASEVADPELDALCQQHDDYFWPHKGGCPACGHDAYVGFASVECCNIHCQNWHYREGM